jgi:hypothetical protein
MANSAKCARPACDCLVPAKAPHGKYCGEECKEAGQITELHCTCPHDECRHPERYVPATSLPRIPV